MSEVRMMEAFLRHPVL